MRTLAERLQISPSTLSRCENGMAPDLMTYRTLCVWLGASMDLFFTTVKPKRKSTTTK
jgi:transcriptional regulator with XRE-family HTH domain